jgi:hypothetical protein
LRPGDLEKGETMVDLTQLKTRSDNLHLEHEAQKRELEEAQCTLIIAATYGNENAILEAAHNWRLWRVGWIKRSHTTMEMSEHLDLIAEAPEAERRCGTCKHWKRSGEGSFGDCDACIPSATDTGEFSRCDDWQEKTHE